MGKRANAIRQATRAGLAGLMMLAAGCAGDTAQGEGFSLISPEQEKELGAREHPKLLERYGGVYEEGDVGAYVAMVGGRVAANSDRPDIAYRFTVLDSPVVNAMALPGGYVYVTRGLLALANSEAELAGVLAHEVGHVTARHTASRVTQGTVANVLAGLLGIATGSGTVAQIAGLAGQGYLASFSRDQEFEADRLGVRSLVRTGYDPFSQADFLAHLQAQAELHAALAGKTNYDPNSVDFFATHPSTPERVRAAVAEARASGVPMESRPNRRDAFLDAIDGMIYGDNPDEGYIRGRRFMHPVLRFGFEVPEGFRLANSSQAVTAQGPQGTAISLDSASVNRSVTTTDYLTRVWQKDLRLREVERIRVNGMEAATGWTVANSNRGQVYARFVAIREARDRIYRFIMIAPPNPSRALLEDFREVTYSFRRLSAAEAAALKPLRLQVVRVRRGDTVESLARRMAFDEAREERFRVLNGLGPRDTLRAGERMKIVVEGR
ncbi:MAG: M48 family metalloprotease [Alphaproteobacteria bacterium]|mgnify:CR=1 FL=1|nr:M48 family metalloprotease [Alphaproteobacteria bacterium]MDX5369768.1 M48 family metalloprotease [Alphaproteobacteria bacterium]MDX5464392.1 M48 family metalloprotease [Alphaproteobacteria bacterium]